MQHKARPFHILNVCWPSGSIEASCEESRVDEIKIVRGKGERAIQIVNLYMNTSVPVPCAAFIMLVLNKGELRLDKTWKMQTADSTNNTNNKRSSHICVVSTGSGIFIRTCNHRFSGISSGFMCGDISIPVTFVAQGG